MWIAIVYERATEQIEWNVCATKDDSVRWVRNTFDTVMAFDQRDDATALSEIEAAGYTVHIEEAEFMPSDTQWEMRLPNGRTIRADGEDDLAEKVREANGKLIRAGSDERVVIVSRAVLYTDWKDQV